MVTPENQEDKTRFEKLKEAQVDRGRDTGDAIQVAAEEVKELRRREGRSKDENEPTTDEVEPTPEKTN